MTAYNEVIAVEKLYAKEKNLLKNRAEVSEELAGVGLSVEAACGILEKTDS